MKSNDVNRRRFLKVGAFGAGALGLMGARFLDGRPAAAGEEKTGGAPAPASGFAEDEVGIRKYNVLGKTGLKVSDISLGGAREPGVLHYALDRGINLYDTAEQYFQGQHEADIGKAFKPVREKVVVITKHLHGFSNKISKKDVIDRFDASLQRMGFEYVDIAMLHHLADPKVLENEELLDAYAELRKAGKFRFFGFSTHDPGVVCDAAIESGLFSVMLLIYNSVQYPQRSEMMKKAAENGIGILAMKTMAGRQQDRIKELVNERTTFSQAAIKWALTDKAVSSVLITMRTFEHIEEYLRASGKALTAKDEEVLKKYAAAVDREYCRIGCTACLDSCPGAVAIPDIMRFGMYYENYGEEKKAMLEYASLAAARKADPCRGCAGDCEAACPHRLSIRERLVHYDGLLRV